LRGRAKKEAAKLRRVPFGSRFETILHRDKNYARAKLLKFSQKLFFIVRAFLRGARFVRVVFAPSVSLAAFPLGDAFFRPDFSTRKNRFCH